MAILRTIVWFFYFFISLTCLLPVMYRAKHLKKLGDDAGCRKILDKYVPMWMSSLMKIAGCKVKVQGLENIPKDRAVVFVCNHQSDYDVPVTMVNLGDTVPAMVAKIETRKIPMVRTWMEMLDCIFIDRQDPRQAITAMKEAGKVLEAGRNIVVFPEGTRSRGDHMNEFKTGVFKIPFNAGAPIVPVVIDGSYKIMEANHNLMTPGVVNLTILPLIETADLDRTEKKELPEKIAKMIAEAKGNC